VAKTLVQNTPPHSKPSVQKLIYTKITLLSKYPVDKLNYIDAKS